MTNYCDVASSSFDIRLPRQSLGEWGASSFQKDFFTFARSVHLKFFSTIVD